jgi:hypothetical protein
MNNQNPLSEYLRYHSMWCEFYVRNFIMPYTQLYLDLVDKARNEKDEKK